VCHLSLCYSHANAIQNLCINTKFLMFWSVRRNLSALHIRSGQKISSKFCREDVHSEGHIHYYKCLVCHFDFESVCDKLTSVLRCEVSRIVLVKIQVY